MHSIREFLQKATQAARNTEIHIPDMPLSGIINTPLAIGGTIAAVVVASKLPMRRGETNKESIIKRLGAVAINAAVGVPVAQIACDLASRQWKSLATIQSIPLGMGLILGGVGLPLFLSLREKIPVILSEGITSLLKTALAARTAPSSGGEDTKP